jgi:hypothetical protein
MQGDGSDPNAPVVRRRDIGAVNQDSSSEDENALDDVMGNIGNFGGALLKKSPLKLFGMGEE